MDLTKARDFSEKLEVLSKTNPMEIYHECDKEGITLTEYLERVDPSGKEARLDAFERQLYLTGVNDRISVESFYAGSRMILLPEWVRRQIKRGMKMAGDIDKMIAVSTRVKGPSVRPIYIKNPEQKGKSLSKLTEPAEMEKVLVTFRDKDLSISEFGLALDCSYRVVKNATLDEFKSILWYVGLNLQTDKLAAVYDTVLNGDGVVGACDSVSAGTSGLDNLTYGDLVSLYADFEKPFTMDSMILSKNAFVKIHTLTEFKDPLAGFNFQKTGRPISPLGAVSHIYKNAGDDKIAAFDSRFAVKEYVENELTIEADKIIAKKLEEVTISESKVYGVYFDKARRYLDMS